jgi:hypothetical protein
MTKLGSSCYCPLTGAKGFVCTFIAGQPIGRAPDGTKFKASVKRSPGRRSRVGKRVLIQVHGEARWLAGKRTETGAVVTEADPIWRGCEVTTDDAEIVEATHA